MGEGTGVPVGLDPLYEVWRAGVPLVRCHSSAFGATEFNPGMGGGRFHPFRSRSGQTVPTLYGSSTVDGALSETVFHDVPPAVAGRSILRSILRPMLFSVLAPARDLTLVQLHGYGLRRLGVTRAELIDCDADHYASTVVWAAALHAHGEEIDGLAWVSRQHDDSVALVLFGDRVARRDLLVMEPPLPLYVGPGFEEVQRAAEAAGIAVLE
jgi:hypothetical protein